MTQQPTVNISDSKNRFPVHILTVLLIDPFRQNQNVTLSGNNTLDTSFNTNNK
jgi:hypothetical protein